VAEVIRYSTPSDGDEDRWLRGFVSWNSVNIPVVSIEQLCNMKPPVPGSRTRIIVIHPVSGGDLSPYGILAEGFPQMVRVSRESLKMDSSYKAPEDAPLICRVQLLHERALIPDLEAIEQQLRSALVEA
jgi:chemotaxis signal transduction protein